jgi:uncharacterized protein YrrD
MQFKQDAKVFLANGDDLGRLDRVVLDPRSGEVSHIVVRKGWLFTEDRVISLDQVEKTSEDEIHLRHDVGELDELPVFQEQHYVDIEDTRNRDREDAAPAAPPVYWYPPVSVPVGFPAYYRMPYAVEVERNIPSDAIPLKDGAKALASGGKQVGVIEQVLTTKEGQVNHIVISQGILGQTKKLIPANWISSVAEDEVHLVVDRDLIERLPDHQS